MCVSLIRQLHLSKNQKQQQQHYHPIDDCFLGRWGSHQRQRVALTHAHVHPSNVLVLLVVIKATMLNEFESIK
jgi:hypothetical protein